VVLVAIAQQLVLIDSQAVYRSLEEQSLSIAVQGCRGRWCSIHRRSKDHETGY